MARLSMKIAFGMVVRGDVHAIENFLKDLDELMDVHKEVQLVHKHSAGGKIWLTEEEPEWEGKEKEEEELGDGK